MTEVDALERALRAAVPDQTPPPDLAPAAAAAGLLDGYKATIHWGYKSVLTRFPNVIVADGYPRFVIDANRVTGRVKPATITLNRPTGQL